MSVHPCRSLSKAYSLEWVVPGFSGPVHCNVVPAVGLVDIYFTLKRKVSKLPRPCMGLIRKVEGGVGTDGRMRTFSAI